MLSPPIAPMLARVTDEIPVGEGWLYEPKWDGFRALVFRDGPSIYLQSRDLKPLDRYFPELRAALARDLPPRCVLDGEIVIAGRDGLDFDALLLRIHPAASRVAKLAAETPASYVVFDLLALGDEDLRAAPERVRRARLLQALPSVRPPIHLTPATTDPSLARTWFERFEGAGLDGVIARRLDDSYHPDRRTMLKIKHERTADCVVGGFRFHKRGPGTMVGSLLLGLYDDAGVLHHVGVTSTFTDDERRHLSRELEPLRRDAERGHPWLLGTAGRGGGVLAGVGEAQRVPGGPSRWNRGKDLAWEPLRIERVCEVAYDHLQGDRFRHATRFRRWRPDKRPADCTYAQLEVTPPAELSRIFG